MATKKVQTATIYMAGPGGKVVQVRPANGKKFELSELQAAVGGYVEHMIAAVRHTTVYVNEEGALKPLPGNTHTWTFADRRVYVELNGYSPRFQVAGNAIVVRSVEQRPAGLPTVAEALAARA